MTLSKAYHDAVALEAEFEADARDIALERAGACLDRADNDGHHHWTQVAWALREMASHSNRRH